MNQDRITREKIFHDERFTEEIRISTQKFYKIERASRNKFKDLMENELRGKKILELGSGKGSFGIKLAELGAQVTGIDISEVAVKFSENEAERKNISANTNFVVMNAEELDFPDNSFDRVIGSSILHHLDLEKSISEIARVLKPNGDAVFLEPLGHNPFINLYRKLTPKLRTEDEHPLKINEFKIFNNYFEIVELNFYHFFTLFAVPFRNSKAFNGILTTLEKIDKTIFNVLPFMRKEAWQTVIYVKNKKAI